MQSDRDARIRDRAYQLWLAEGRVHGRHADHWHRAEREIAAEEAKAASGSGSRQRSAAAKPASPGRSRRAATKAATTAEARPAAVSKARAKSESAAKKPKAAAGSACTAGRPVRRSRPASAKK